MPIDQASMYSQLAATGMFSGGGSPPPNAVGGGKIALLAGLGDTNLQNLSPKIGWGDNTIKGGLLGVVFTGGGYGGRPGQQNFLQKFAASMVAGGQQASQGAESYRQMIAAGIQLPSMPNISFGGGDFLGSGLGGAISNIMDSVTRLGR